MVNRYNMEIVAQNRVKVPVDEFIYELIKVIKPKYSGDSCRFLEGPLWSTHKRTYNEKLVNRSYWLVNHHLYRVFKIESGRAVSTYWRVSGRGNVNPITKEEAIEVINNRVGYIEDSDLELPPNDDPEIPYNTPTCDW